MAYPDAPIEFARTDDMPLVRAIMTLPGLYEWTVTTDPRPGKSMTRRSRSHLVRPGAREGQPVGAVDADTAEWNRVRGAYQSVAGPRLQEGAASGAGGDRVGLGQRAELPAADHGVPAFNRVAHQFALDAGFRRVGVRKNFLKLGTKYDQAILGLSPE